MPGDFIACDNNRGVSAKAAQPVQKANSPLIAALEAAKAARLPDHMEAQLSRIGVMAPAPKREPLPDRVWIGPTEDQPECPF